MSMREIYKKNRLPVVIDDDELELAHRDLAASPMEVHWEGSGSPDLRLKTKRGGRLCLSIARGKGLVLFKPSIHIIQQGCGVCRPLAFEASLKMRVSGNCLRAGLVAGLHLSSDRILGLEFGVQRQRSGVGFDYVLDEVASWKATGPLGSSASSGAPIGRGRTLQLRLIAPFASNYYIGAAPEIGQVSGILEPYTDEAPSGFNLGISLCGEKVHADLLALDVRA